MAKDKNNDPLFGDETPEEKKIREEKEFAELEEEEKRVAEEKRLKAEKKKQKESVPNNLPEWAKAPNVIVKKNDEKNFFPKENVSKVIDDGQSRVNKEWSQA